MSQGSGVSQIQGKGHHNHAFNIPTHLGASEWILYDSIHFFMWSYPKAWTLTQEPLILQFIIIILFIFYYCRRYINKMFLRLNAFSPYDLFSIWSYWPRTRGWTTDLGAMILTILRDGLKDIQSCLQFYLKIYESHSGDLKWFFLKKIVNVRNTNKWYFSHYFLAENIKCYRCESARNWLRLLSSLKKVSSLEYKKTFHFF